MAEQVVSDIFRTTEAGRVVVKAVPADCLLNGQLRESIKERLSRIREVPHSKVANLLSVEREGDGAVIVWEYIEGENLELASEGKSLPALIDLCERGVRCVEAFHAQGLVHGAIHGRNIIVRDGQPILIDVSPLLYTDFQDDIRAMVKMFESMVSRHSCALVIDSGEISLRDLSEALERCRDPNSDHEPNEPTTKPPRLRKSTFAAALLLALAGGAMTFAIWWFISHNFSAKPGMP